ncbi:MAG: TatD family hydrolase [Clostridiales bacterium]|nr:TatD family hydrolase [Clostridiales bacterium]
MPLFDTHCHYDDSWFDEDRDALLASLPAQGVELALNPGCNLASSRKAVSYAETYPHIYAAVGFHPSDAADYSDEAEEMLRRLARHDKVKAIGEIGLDYYWADYPSHEVQKEVFRRQLRLAEELGLPVIVHDREAHGDCLAVVREFPNVRGVYHCYSGSLEDAKTLIALGWNLSFTGSITYKNAKKAPEVIAWLPEDRFMIETDSPYMLPYPREKGERRNDSTKVIRVARRIAALRGMEVEEVIRVTTENGKRFFRIP